MLSSIWVLPSLVFALVLLPRLIHARAVFAHYMVGIIADSHVAQDVQDAIDMGLDGFVLNIGNPYDKYVGYNLQSLFNHASGTNFKLFISMDLMAQATTCTNTGIACNGPSDFSTLFDTYLSNGSYFLGPNGKPVVSTFSAGDWPVATFTSLRQNYDIYFIPDFDGTEGYYEATAEWWNYWAPAVDGVFSWEAAWPLVNSTDDGDISRDQTVVAAAVKHARSYMMGLSLLQYKNSYATNLYRHGEQNWPMRMQKILSMDPAPLFVEIISWNDGPESHYIGNLWPEQNTEWQPGEYATQVGAPHTGLQPIINSFANAFRQQSTEMVPPGSDPVGAMWYKTILESSVCPDDGQNQFRNRPLGYFTGDDALNWAVILPSDYAGYTIHLISDGNLIMSVAANPGLNYGSTATTGNTISTGTQILQLLDSNMAVQWSTTTGRCVSGGCPDGIYNYNPQVLPLKQVSPITYSCIATSIISVASTTMTAVSTSTQFHYGPSGHRRRRHS